LAVNPDLQVGDMCLPLPDLRFIKTLPHISLSYGFYCQFSISGESSILKKMSFFPKVENLVCIWEPLIRPTLVPNKKPLIYFLAIKRPLGVVPHRYPAYS
jgi:hypothetical protein